MQIIGIYLINGKSDVIKCLKPNCWYPFGNFSNCHEEKLKTGKLTKIQNEIIDNKDFINKLYGSSLNKNKRKIPFSINCIVGQNGTGKSTLLNLYYRIINNFSVKFHSKFPNIQNTFSPIWSSGFEAELYYECNGKIGCIFSGEKKSKEIPIQLFYNDHYDLFETPLDKKQVIDFIYDSFFYTIATDYSLYSSSELSEEWKSNLYHKNDGYYTPIVLLPFRDENNIDINRENELAKERIEVLSLLMSIKQSELISGYFPHSIKYKLRSPRNYRAYMRRKLEEIYRSVSHKMSQKTLTDNCNKFLKILSVLWATKIHNSNKDASVLENGLLYLSYKTIKTCSNYEIYKDLKIFKPLDNLCSNKFDIINYLEKGERTNSKIEIELDNLLNIIDKLLEINDHTTKKIRHTYYFLNNNIYMGASQKEGIIDAYAFIEWHEKNNRLSYNDIADDLLPPIYETLFYLRKIESKEKIELNALSSGELQFINSLSYIVYHLVNIQSISSESNRVRYKNVSLIFDEAEIYYHPEYQRLFIYKLINLLDNCNFFNYFEINTTIITHSPFMVSDIPPDNVLRLLKSDKKVDIGKTFSANIYDLLKHQFYLSAPVGGVAEEIFNTIIADYRDNQFEKYKDKEFYNELIKQIGDSYFKKSMEKYLLYLMDNKDEKN